MFVTRANPVLNLNIDTATDLGFDEEGSSADRVRYTLHTHTHTDIHT